MTVYIQKVKGQLPFDIMMFCKNTFPAIIQHHNSETEADILTNFHICSDAESVSPPLGDCIDPLYCRDEDVCEASTV